MKKIQIELSPNQFVTICFALRKAIVYTEFFDPSYNHYIVETGTIPGYLKSYKELYTRFDNLLGWPDNVNLVKCNDLHAKLIERKE